MQKQDQFPDESSSRLDPDSSWSNASLGARLRSEILPTSQLDPDLVTRRSAIRRIGLILGLFLTASSLCWLLFFGPGRSLIESRLIRLAARVTRPTATFLPTSFVLEASVEPTRAPTPTPTRWLALIPTATPITTTAVPIPTAPAPIASPTVSPLAMLTPTSLLAGTGCVNALTITLADIGQTLCVQGIILNLVQQSNASLIAFSAEPGAFYLITYDLVWNKGEEGDCIQITGKIQQLANSPVLVFGYQNLPEFCPVSPTGP